MLFNINKKTSRVLLQLLGALSVLLIPSFLNMLSLESGIYLLFTVLLFVGFTRIKNGVKFTFSKQHIVWLFLLGYGVLSLLWVDNPSLHILYLFFIGTIILFDSLLKDYFYENSAESFKRRLAYFIGVSGMISAVVNIIYWLTYIVPVAGKDGFSAGLSSRAFLGIFMAICIACTVSLFGGNSKPKRIFFTLSVIAMLFVFIMTKSSVSWLFAVCLALLVIIKKFAKKSNKYMAFSAGVIALYAFFVIIRLVNSESGKAFSDVFAFFLKNLFGAGGGFWSGKETFSHFDYSNSCAVGGFAYLSASAGIAGFIASIIFFLRNVILFIKLKTTESAVSVLLLISLLLLPLKDSTSFILILAALNSYNEYYADKNYRCAVRPGRMKKLTTAVTIIVILSSLLTVLSFIKMNAQSAYKNKNYQKSYELYKTVAAVNFIDSSSCAMAALSICKDKDLTEIKREEALAFADRAIKYDSSNMENISLKAKVYTNGKEYDLAAQQYRTVSAKSVRRYDSDLALAKVLFKIVEENEKGSIPTKRAYEEIVSIAQSTENLDYKKEIFDIADRALPYTKGDFTNEGKITAE